MSTEPPKADAELLKKLVLGQLPSAQAEQLATEYGDDSRIAELGASLDSECDTVMNLIPGQDTVADQDDEVLVLRMQERLKSVFPAASANPTTASGSEESSTSAPVPSPALPARLEYYQPLSILGQGGMGAVYLALDTRLGREVALKTLRSDRAADSQAKERFLREARAAAKLSHDHLVPIFYVGEADGIPFLAMPLLKGQTVESLIRQTAGPLPIEQTLRIAREAAAGLAAAHDAGLIHRDIKPSNLWLEAPGGRVKVLDFGLAKASGTGVDSHDETHLTTCGTVVGTPAYMSPEQARGQTLDGRADLFSLGCVLYEALTGQRPFAGADTMAVLMNLATHTPPAPHTLNAKCPPAFSRLVMQLLEKDPAARPASAHVVIDALTDIERAPFVEDTTVLPASTSIPAGALPPTHVRPTAQAAPDSPSQSRSRRLLLAFGGALVMLLAFAIFQVKTDRGTLVIQIEDPTVQAILEKNGLVLRDKESDRTWTITAAEKKPLPSGQYQVDDHPDLHLLVTDDTGTEFTAESFTLKRKGEVRVKVTLETPAAIAIKPSTPPTPMPTTGTATDRRAAEWVLANGGSVQYRQNGERHQAVKLDDLQPGELQLLIVNMTFNPKVNDNSLTLFKDCRELEGLFVNGNGITDAGLAHLKGQQTLVHLMLGETSITDAGLQHFRDRSNFIELDLSARGVTAAGVAVFRDCRQLYTLCLRGANIGDDGLSGLPDLAVLSVLDLRQTRVTDATLERVARFPKLGLLRLNETRVSEAGVKKLAAALPACKIEWDGGVIEPRDGAPPPTGEPASDRPLPFVRVSPAGEVRGEYRFANEAFAILGKDDVLEVHGNGPFKVGQVHLRDSSLHIRAGKGYRPRFVVGFEIPAEARKFQGETVRWFTFDNVELTVTGCDFIGEMSESSYQFAGSGKKWVIEDCRMIQPVRNWGSIIVFQGDSLTVRDSLLSITSHNGGNGNVASLPGVPQVRFERNVLSAATVLGLDSGVPQSVVLQENTIYAAYTVVVSKTANTGDHPIVDAQKNLVLSHSGGMFMSYGESVPHARPKLTWKGHQNRYLPLQPGYLWQRPVAEGEAPSGLKTVDEWNAYWKNPDDLQQIDKVHFAWDLFSETDLTVARDRCAAEILQARRRVPELSQVGPEMDRVGSGSGYDNVLKTEQTEPLQLRPKAPEGGPFVLMRGGQVVAGYVSLDSVLPHAKDGDVIEIRSDGPFPAFELGHAYEPRLTVRAGAGYRPSFARFYAVETMGDWTLEGLHIRGKSGEPSLWCRAQRIANCSVGSLTHDGRIQITAPVNSDRPIEIVNCYLPNTLALNGPKTRIENSLLAVVNPSSQEESQLEIVHCGIWSHSSPQRPQLGSAIGNDAHARIRCVDTLFDADALSPAMQASWQGERNLYRMSVPNWPGILPNKHTYIPIYNLADWRRHWKSDVDSKEDDSIVVRQELWSQEVR